MSKKDTITKSYMGDNARFADAFNYLLYGGRQVIKPECLSELDTTAMALPHAKSESPVPIQRYRDLMKVFTTASGGKVAYRLILGAENQSEVHYAMPPKNMLYDAAEYAAQVTETAKSHRKENGKPETNAEYLSGFYRTDKLIPVITLTIYFGVEEWTAPRSLYEMFDQNIPLEILQFVPDYRINLIAPAEIPDEDFSKFQTELRIVLEYIKNSGDKKKLKELVQRNARYRSVSRETVDLINTMTTSKIKYSEREEKIDMCEAIKGMLEDSRQEGRLEEKKRSVHNMREHGLTAEIISEYLGISVDEVRNIINSDK